MEERGDVVVVGTAHVSSKSAEDVREAVREHDPAVVAVELDSKRYESLRDGGGGGYGADMAAAIEEAETRDVPVALIDRDITTTLKRMWSEMTVVERLKMAGAFVAGVFGVGTTSVEELERSIEEGSVDEYVEDLRSFSPGGARTLIDERDAYMATRLMEIAEKGDVVAVVGAGHRAGIEDYLEHPEEIPEVSGTREAMEADADVFESDDELVVVMDVPGCDRDDIDVVYEAGELEVTASSEVGPDPGYHHVVRGNEGSVEASVDLPCGVDAEAASASYDDGVLEVRLPKR